MGLRTVPSAARLAVRAHPPAASAALITYPHSARRAAPFSRAPFLPQPPIVGLLPVPYVVLEKLMCVINVCANSEGRNVTLSNDARVKSMSSPWASLNDESVM